MPASVRPQIVQEDRASGAKEIKGSLRYSKDKLHTFYYTNPSEGNYWSWTFSTWIRKSRNGYQGSAFGAYLDQNNRTTFRFFTDNRLNIQHGVGGTYKNYTTSHKFTDVQGWYHIVYRYSSWHWTAGERVTVWINGQKVTEWDASENYDQHWKSPVGRGPNYKLMMGCRELSSGFDSYFDGLQTETYLIDGGHLTADDFGYHDRLTGQWRPKKYEIPTHNDGTTWSSSLSILSGGGSLSNAANAFNGNIDSFCDTSAIGAIIRFTPPTPIKYKKNVRVFLRCPDHQARLNGGSWVVNSASASCNGAWVTLAEGTPGTITTLDVQYTGGSASAINAISVDEETLLDGSTSHLGINGFYFPQDGFTPGTSDQSGSGRLWSPSPDFNLSAPLDRATGALPILNTDPTGKNLIGGYGEGGVRKDVTASTPSIVKKSGCVGFDGNGSYITIPQCHDLNFDTSNFSMEHWVYIPNGWSPSNAYWPCSLSIGGDGNNENCVSIYWNGNRNVSIIHADSINRLHGGGDAWSTGGAGGPNDRGDQWVHVAVTRDNSDSKLRLFINGVLEDYDDDIADYNSRSDSYIGISSIGSSNYFKGSISNVRVVKGSIPTEYQTSSTTKTTKIFDPPTEPVTTTSQGTTASHVKLIACQSSVGIGSTAHQLFAEPGGTVDLLDGSGTNFTLTGATASTANPFGNATSGSVSFDGTDDNIQIGSTGNGMQSNHKMFHLGVGDFTQECWIYQTEAFNDYASIWGQFASSVGHWLHTEASGKIVWGESGSIRIESTATLSLNTWHHIVLQRKHGRVSLYVDGAFDKSWIWAEDNDQPEAESHFMIGGLQGFTRYFGGNISNFRFVKGRALYNGSTFTVPTSDLTAVPGTVLLCCQSRTDAAQYNNTDTTPAFVMNGQPFATASESSTHCVYAYPMVQGRVQKDESPNIRKPTVGKNTNSTNITGGANPTSTTMNGNAYPFYKSSLDCGDKDDQIYSIIDENPDFDFGNGGWTMEIWFRRTSNSQNDGFMGVFDFDSGATGSESGTGYTNAGWIAYLEDSATELIYFYYGNAGGGGYNHFASIPSCTQNGSWMHVAFCVKGNSDQVQVYRNGVRVLNTTLSKTDWGASNKEMYLGWQNAGNRWIDGQMCDFRVYKGFNKYTENFVPAGSHAETDFLLDVPSSGAYNKIALPDVCDSKTGGSVTFNGYYSGQVVQNSSDFTFGTGSWTIECWILCDKVVPQGCWRAFLSMGPGHNTSKGITLYAPRGNSTTGTSTVILNSVNPTMFTGSVVADGGWHHMALVKDSKEGVTRYFVDGKEECSVADTTDYDATDDLYIGYAPDCGDLGGHAGNYAGLISNLRITKGQAIYISEFDVPTEPLTLTSQGAIASNVKFLGCMSTNNPQDYIKSPGAITNHHSNSSTMSPFRTKMQSVCGMAGNYATMDPLSGHESLVYSNGNLTVWAGTTDGANIQTSYSTLGMLKGKYYAEFTVIETTSNGSQFGVGTFLEKHHTGNQNGSKTGMTMLNIDNGSADWRVVHVDGTSQTATSDQMNTPALGSVIGIAFDADRARVRFYVNGAQWGEDEYPVTMLTNEDSMGKFYFFATARYNGNQSAYAANYGQLPFTYAPPEGYLPLSVENLHVAEGSMQPEKYHGAITWEGNDGTSKSIPGLGFKPDLVWIKQYAGGSQNHLVYDSIRGTDKYIKADESAGESTNATFLTSMDDDGITVGDQDVTNASGESHIAWCWKGGGSSGTFNVDGTGYSTAAAAGMSGGTITATGCSVNKKSGFSIVTYNGTGSSGDIPHGLDDAPKFILIKALTGTHSWAVYHKAIGSGQQILLNSTNITPNADAHGFDAVPDSTVVHVGSGAMMDTNQSGGHVMYSWAEVPGISKFGSYHGTGDADGPFINCGFKPHLIMIKGWKSDDGSIPDANWYIYDATRCTYNTCTKSIEANLSVAENVTKTNYSIDFLSNGFKIVSYSNGINLDPQDEFIYMAWAGKDISKPYGVGAQAPGSHRSLD